MSQQRREQSDGDREASKRRRGTADRCYLAPAMAASPPPRAAGPAAPSPTSSPAESALPAGSGGAARGSGSRGPGQ